MKHQKKHSTIVVVLLQSAVAILLLVLKFLYGCFFGMYYLYVKIRVVATVLLGLIMISGFIGGEEYNWGFGVMLLVGGHGIGFLVHLLMALSDMAIDRIRAYLGLEAEKRYSVADLYDVSDDSDDDLTIDDMIFMDMMDEDD